jgi:predicted hotdog family 3-hydroxylacyl-ACP dehydratase
MNLVEQLPHKAPALLIGNPASIGEGGATCPILTNPDASLAPDELLPSPLGLEAMAQTAAVWMCWRYKAVEAKGMLVQCRDFEMHTRHLNCADGLSASAEPVSVGSATGLYQFTGEIRDARGTILARGSFMIYVKGGA